MLVLYAEDDIDDFNVFVEVVQSIQPAVRCMNAINGLQTLEMLEELVVLPELIFLDINMPTMDGKSCLKAIKNDSRFSEIPVYIYTTGTNPMDIDQCRQLGATDYLVKPNSFEEAKNTFRRLFSSLDVG